MCRIKMTKRFVGISKDLTLNAGKNGSLKHAEKAAPMRCVRHSAGWSVCAQDWLVGRLHHVVQFTCSALGLNQFLHASADMKEDSLTQFPSARSHCASRGRKTTEIEFRDTELSFLRTTVTRRVFVGNRVGFVGTTVVPFNIFIQSGARLVRDGSMNEQSGTLILTQHGAMMLVDKFFFAWEQVNSTTVVYAKPNCTYCARHPVLPVCFACSGASRKIHVGHVVGERIWLRECAQEHAPVDTRVTKIQVPMMKCFR